MIKVATLRLLTRDVHSIFSGKYNYKMTISSYGKFRNITVIFANLGICGNEHYANKLI